MENKYLFVDFVVNSVILKVYKI